VVAWCCIDSTKDKTTADKTSPNKEEKTRSRGGSTNSFGGREQNAAIHGLTQSLRTFAHAPPQLNGQNEAWGGGLLHHQTLRPQGMETRLWTHARVAPCLVVATVCLGLCPSLFKSHEKGPEEATRRAKPKRPPGPFFPQRSLPSYCSQNSFRYSSRN
jgi:hypothetical protein